MLHTLNTFHSVLSTTPGGWLYVAHCLHSTKEKTEVKEAKWFAWGCTVRRRPSQELSLYLLDSRANLPSQAFHENSKPEMNQRKKAECLLVMNKKCVDSEGLGTWKNPGILYHFCLQWLQIRTLTSPAWVSKWEEGSRRDAPMCGCPSLHGSKDRLRYRFSLALKQHFSAVYCILEGSTKPKTKINLTHSSKGQELCSLNATITEFGQHLCLPGARCEECIVCTQPRKCLVS